MKLPVSVPNMITSLRILLIPVLVIVFYSPVDWRYWAAAGVFTLASITDWLDGYLARKLAQMTPFGAFLDPVADKLIIVVVIILLVESHASALLTIPALVIVGREIVVSALREWMAEIGTGTSMAVSFLGKLKTTVQMISLIILLASGPDITDPFVILGYVGIYAAAILTLWSMYLYLKIAWPHLSSGLVNEDTADDEDAS